MAEAEGWLLDAYAGKEGGVTLWLLRDSGERLRLQMDLPVRFYAAGDHGILRQAWRSLGGQGVELARMRRRDLFSGELDLLSVTAPTPGQAARVFRELSARFPALDYYDADIPVSLRFIERTGVHPLGRCRVHIDGETACALEPLDSPWQLHPEPVPLRVLELAPDTDPTIGAPRALEIRYGRVRYSLALDPLRPLLVALEGVLKRFDPDIILTDYGDTWLFPKLREWAPALNPNRDKERMPLTRKANTYFAYGQVVHRGEQTHLFGRWHIDRRNALLFNEIGLNGVLELARVTGISAQDMARKSPGAGITAMQMLAALRSGVLVPVVKQQSEGRKSLSDLIRADKGGLIYQPLVGLHRNVAQIDFASMYPSIMVNHNISPETSGVEGAGEGLIPRTLRPLVEKRLALKDRLLELDARDCRVKELKERSSALKWLLVVCFGYLGYKNARFGKIESHEAVTAISRELMLQAKETAEDMGYTVLHMYVDSLFVQKEGLCRQKDFRPLLEKIRAQTGIPIALEGVYKWVVFPPSKRDRRIPVPNRYFGAFQDGEIKARGIALRRHDTPRFVASTQLGLLKIMAQADDPDESIPAVRAFLKRQVGRLKAGRIPLEDLLVAKKLSRELEAYKVPSPAALAAGQLQAQGAGVRAGMRVRFWYVYGGVKIRDTRESEIDVKRYARLVNQMAEEVFYDHPRDIQPGLFRERSTQPGSCYFF